MFKKPLGFSNGGYINPPIVLMVVGILGAWLLSPLSKVVRLPNDLFMAYKRGLLTTYKSWDDPPSRYLKPPFGEKARLGIEDNKEKPYHLEI